MVLPQGKNKISLIVQPIIPVNCLQTMGPTHKFILRTKTQEISMAVCDVIVNLFDNYSNEKVVHLAKQQFCREKKDKEVVVTRIEQWARTHYLWGTG